MITQTRFPILLFLFAASAAAFGEALFPAYLHCADTGAEVDFFDFNFSKLSVFIDGEGDEQALRWRRYGQEPTSGLSSTLEETHDYLIWRGYTDEIVPFTLEIHRIAQPGKFLRPADLKLGGKRQELMCYFASGRNTRGLCDLYAFPVDKVLDTSPGFLITVPEGLSAADKASLLARLQSSPVVKQVQTASESAYRLAVREERPYSELHEALRQGWCRDKGVARVEIAPNSSVSSGTPRP